MVFIKSYLLCSLAIVVSLVTAAPTNSCPAGQTVFTQYNEGIIDASPYHVWQYIGEFFDVSWQGFELIGTTGKDNTPGATRTFSTLGLTLTERLDQNIGSTSWGPWQFFFQQKFTLLGNPQVAGASVTNVHDVLKVYPVWGGSKISWTVTGCANVTAIAQAVFDQVHGGAIQGTVTKFAS
ncbi:hypothetical protein QFC21_004070 [Naganishia friedmannii]|uniref:Uncharacterized protein n=1 Tax=Naganishia friedmannii TaxID=89922 RepID=A0ACC2VIH1_9TREE|nr:hypothetical protein QFC21_004070 [Naganishia friedmannii]